MGSVIGCRYMASGNRARPLPRALRSRQERGVLMDFSGRKGFFSQQEEDVFVFALFALFFTGYVNGKIC